MSLDAQRYIHHLDGMDLSEAEKIQFIRTLWLIAQCFVDDAFSGRAENAGPSAASLKTGFEAASVIDLGTVRKPRTAATNDNAASCAKRSTEYEERPHERQRQ